MVIILIMPSYYASLSLVLFIRFFFRESQKSKKKFEVPLVLVLSLEK